jgi:hypothetical protein
MKSISKFTIVTSLLLSAFSVSAEMTVKEEQFYKKASELLQSSKLSIYTVSESSIPNYFEADLSNGRTILISKDGKTGIIERGKGVEIFDFQKNISLTKSRKSSNALEYVNFNDPIMSYKAKDEIGEIRVFADIQCGHCQNLHSEIPDFNDAGISVHYYPVSNFKYSDIYMNAAYCSDEPEATYSKLTEDIKKMVSEARVSAKGGTRDDFDNAMELERTKLNAKALKLIKKSDCETYDMNKAAYNFKGFGITGTPTILFSDGTMVEGKMALSDVVKAVKRID